MFQRLYAAKRCHYNDSLLMSSDVKILNYWSWCQTRYWKTIKNGEIYIHFCLIYTACHSVSEFVSKIWIKQSDWLKIRNGRGIIIHSAGQGLRIVWLYISCSKWVMLLNTTSRVYITLYNSLYQIVITYIRSLTKVYIKIAHYENTPIQKYWKFHHQKVKVFR